MLNDPIIPPEDRLPGALRGAGARPPIFWKSLLVIMALIWGFSFYVMKEILDTLPPSYMLAVRFLVSALVLGILFFKRIRAHFRARTLWWGMLLGALMWAGYTFLSLGLVETTAGKNAFLTGTYCVMVPFVAHLVTGETLTRYNVGAALLCLAGIGFVALDNFSLATGDLLTLIGALFFALQIAYMSKAGTNFDINVLTFWMFLVIGVLSLNLGMLTETAPPSSAWTPSFVGMLLFLAIICTCVGLLIQNLAVAHVPASTASLLLSLESPSGVFFSVMLAGELLSGRLLVGFGLIFFSIIVAETKLAFLFRTSRRA
ncbi:DMT family transporter [Collinsella sp. zg1085]|nr:DMT family transporter [Collinsella sp. zg1085]